MCVLVIARWICIALTILVTVNAFLVSVLNMYLNISNTSLMVHLHDNRSDKMIDPFVRFYKH